MANEPDGSIKVDTGMDTKGFKAGTVRIKNAVAGLLKSLKSITDFRLRIDNTDAIAKSEELKAKIIQLEQELNALVGVSTLPGFNTSAFQAKISETEAKLVDARARLQELTDAISDAESSPSRAGGGFEALGEVVSSVASRCKSLTGKILGVTGALAKAGVKGAVTGLKKLGSGVKSAISHFKSFRSSSKGTEGVISKLTKKITGLGSMLKRMVLRKILLGVIQGVKDGINNLAQYSDEVNGNLSTLKSGLTQLKNSLATAFAPILTVITPILSKLISYLSEVITKVGQFFAAFTGKNTFTKAVAVQENYAASLDKSSKSSAKATKAAKKYGDALDLDEVHDIQSISDNDNSNSDSGVSPADMFTTAPIESKIAEFAKKIKNAIKSGDLFGAGELLGKGLNNIVGKIDKFATGINWQNLTASFAKGLNGFVVGINWSLLGKTIGDLINIPIKAIYGFVTTFDWRTLGTSLADGFTTMVETIDLVKAAEGLSQTVVGLINALASFIEGTDWQVVGNKIADCLGAIDWRGLISALAEGIGAALGGLAALLWGLIEDAWNSVVKWWRDTAYEDGKFTIEGLLNGIWEKMKNIVKWINEHIRQPFIGGFEKAFKIKSPSRIMEEEGSYIVAGLKNGVKGLATAGLDKIKSLFINMKTDFRKFAAAGKTWGSDICSNLASGINKATDLVGNAATKVASKIKALLGFSEPEEGPLSDFHTYMPDMLKLMADGIDKNKGVALKAVSGLAEDVSKQIQNGDFTFNSIGFDSEIDAAMTDFSDVIVDGFADMLDRLQAIADSVTFTMPQVATGIIPSSGYSSGGLSHGDKTEFLDGLYDVLKDVIMSVKPYNGRDEDRPITLQGDVNIDGHRAGTILAQAVYKELIRQGLIRIH